MKPQSPPSAAAAEEFPVGRGHARWTLSLLFMLMLFDFIDRQVLAALLPPIKAEWNLSDTQLGMLVGAVNVAIGLLAFPTAYVIDRWDRRKAMGIMAIVWSLATIACSFAGNAWQLMAARFVVGAGEAGYGAGGNSLLASIYPARMRSTVIGISQAAVPLGTVFGVVLGGLIAAKWGWRYAFGLVAIPGLLLAFLVFSLRDPQAQQRSALPNAQAGWVEVLLTLFKNPIMLLIFSGQMMQTFLASTLGSWLPSFFSRSYQLPVDKAGLWTGGFVLATALGAALGGLVVDKWARGFAHRRLLGAAILVGLMSVFAVAAFSAPAGSTQLMCLFIACFLMLTTLGPVQSAVIDLAPAGMKASSIGALNASTNLLGMSIGPLAAGMLSDRYDLTEALRIIAFLPFAAALVYALAGRLSGAQANGRH